ncbi:mandelate racemase [Embleya sp. NBC_00888]|uniref:enolase C-terminal domain-like protein n=1 Tax=Embleya sp. NBC_00888 TaxID=2975960 RepID=UPI00386F74F3|nr:mandelate racemase [Embleya sp. NBC_00888]
MATRSPGLEQGASLTTSVVRRVRAWSLPPQPVGLPAGLAPEVAAVATEPAGPRWAEHHTRFALELVADEHSGWAGPISEVGMHLILDDHASGLIGLDTAQPRRLPYRPTTGRHHQGAHARIAASTIELACWDLASKACGRPVTNLLGGMVRPCVPAYASALALDPEHPDAPSAAAAIKAGGYWGQKWPLPKSLIIAGPKAVERTYARLREAAGGDRFMIDAAGRCHMDEAMRLLPVFADLGIEWVEELAPPTSWIWHRLRACDSGVPFAAGEHAVDPAEQVRLLAQGGVDVWQTDPGWCGGLARSLHTVELAADLGLRSFTHGAHLAAAVALAGACCRDKVPAVEYHLTVEPLRQQVYTRPLSVMDGWIEVPQAPGLTESFVLDEDKPRAEVTA